MTEKCRQCGHIQERSGACDACGSIEFGILTLRSVESGAAVSFRIRTRVGRRVLGTILEPDDAKFMASDQFELDKSVEPAAWVIRCLSGAVNPTHLNAEIVGTEGTVLQQDDVISIGGTHARLRVEIDLP
jgi:hypothetical protein